MKLTSKQKLAVAKAWINIVIVTLSAIVLGLVGLLFWWIAGLVEWKIILAILAGAIVFFSLLWITEKAETYIDKHGGWRKK